MKTEGDFWGLSLDLVRAAKWTFECFVFNI